jgi:DNA ligase-associated metallophosphoesterase
MNGVSFSFAGHTLMALPSGGLWWKDARILCVSDLHMGKSDRIARRSGTLLPPFETRDTLTRLQADVATYDPKTVICLGDSFDDLGAVDAMNAHDHDLLMAMMAGRDWVWIEGNHDPGPVALGGSHRVDLSHDGVLFRHIADPESQAEISGHYHPKIAVSGPARPCFLYDTKRLIMPAYGTYTGGLRCDADVLVGLMGHDAIAILAGKTMARLPAYIRPAS